MLFQSKITKLASIPPWANVVTLADGERGFWTQTNVGEPVFLRHKDGRIHLPKTFRGKLPDELSPEDFKMLPKEDMGKTHYKTWRSGFEKQQAVGKLYNGYAFSDEGQVLIERMRKLVDKYELDNVANIGLDPSYSINPKIFDRMLSSNTIDVVRRLGRTVAKRVKTISVLLQATNPKLAERLDADFSFQYAKLQDLFDFDPKTFKPEIPEPEEPEQGPDFSMKLHEWSCGFQKAVEPLLQSPLMGRIVEDITNVMSCMVEEFVDESHVVACRQAFEKLTDDLVNLVKIAPNHPVGQTSDQILNLPELKQLYNLLYLGDFQDPVAINPACEYTEGTPEGETPNVGY